MSLWAELSRRNVIKVAMMYAVVGWLVAQIMDLAIDAFTAPDWVMKIVLVVLVLGFPVALVFAWAFELTPEGIKLEKDVDRSESITGKTGQILNRSLLLVLSLAVVVLLVDKFYLRAGTDDAGSLDSGEVTAPADGVQRQPLPDPGMIAKADDRSIAVLPFVSMSSGADDEYFADGLTEEILNVLTRIPDLLVTARTSAFAFKGKNLEIPRIAEALGVQHVVEGSVRRSGERVRITAQLVRAEDGFHLWSQTYDRELDDVFAIQEDIAQSIARALDVVLDDQAREVMARTGTRNVDAFINLQKGYELYQRAHGGAPQIPTLMEANRFFEAAIEAAPEYPEAYLYHSDLFSHLLLLEASGAPVPPEAVDIMGNARNHLSADLANAGSMAVHESQRLNAELTLVLLSDDWRRAPTLMKSMELVQSCFAPLWIQQMAPLGYGDLMFPTFERLIQCDPAAEQGWVHGSLIALWIGDQDRALSIAEAGMRTLPEHGRLDYSMMLLLLAKGEFEQVELLLESAPPAWQQEQVILLAAARNEIEEAQALTERYWAERPKDDQDALRFAAIMGDRDLANALAGQIDVRPIGPTVLSLVVYHCACGAPFDLDAVPNFQRILKEAQLSWPPPEVINYPAKDW